LLSIVASRNRDCKVNLLDLTVGIINWNTKKLLERCLEVLFQDADSHNSLIVVADNNSTDGSQEMVKKEFPQVRLIANDANVGFATAANHILKTSRTPFVLLLNSDTEVTSGSLRIMVDFMKDNPDVAAAGPLILNFDGSIQYSCRNFPSFIDATVHAFLGAFSPSNPYSARYKMVDFDRDKQQRVDWISGAAMCLRREAVEKIGYFDESYYMYVEDMDLCFRLWRSGYKVYYLPRVKVYHHIGQSSKQINTKMVFEHQKSIYRFYSKLYADKPWRHIKFLIGIGLFCRSILLILLNWIKGVRSKEPATGK